MVTSVTAVVVGLAVYLALVFALYGFHQFALLDTDGTYPDWYAPGELLLRALTSVAPGMAAAWACTARGFFVGACVGGVGGTAEALVLGALLGVPLGEFGARVFLAAVSTGFAAAVTNAVGGVAGEALREKYKR
jgi:hypothetical protein